MISIKSFNCVQFLVQYTSKKFQCSVLHSTLHIFWVSLFTFHFKDLGNFLLKIPPESDPDALKIEFSFPKHLENFYKFLKN